MYWLYGAPSIFAVSKRQLCPNSTATSGDDVSTPADDIPSHSLANGATSPPPEGPAEKTVPVNGGENTATLNEKVKEREIGASRTNGVQGQSGSTLGEDIVGMCTSRNGQVFITITASTLTVWQTKPTTAVAAAVRSPRSLRSYGTNVRVVLHPDSTMIVVQTSLGFLVTYTLAIDPNARTCKPVFPESVSGHTRHKSFSGRMVQRGDEPPSGPGEGSGVWEASIQFHMVMRVNEGISSVTALDDELVLATNSPAVVYCIRWRRDSTSPQTSTISLKSLSWMDPDGKILEMAYDRPMNISTWIMSDGKAYAVQRANSSSQEDDVEPRMLFKGYCFHTPDSDDAHATKTAINARFSLIAVGCADGSIRVYTARDYVGHIPLSHRLSVSVTASNVGKLTFLAYSPDGYCLFAGYENGWASWSVYGKPGANSFAVDRAIAKANDEQWLLGIQDGFWIGGGSQLVLLSRLENRFWVMDVARSAVAGCFSSANVTRSLLQTSTGFMIYRGYDLPDFNALSAEYGLWHNVQVPSDYLAHQWPIRSAIISTDGRYVAIAGRRGLAHYSVNSARWKTFDNPADEDEFTVRGGMCWHQHLLIAAVESNDAYEIRVYSREAALDNSQVMHVEEMTAPIVLISPSGEDSLLVYTYENNLHHYIINFSNKSVKLVQVGQIALHGIIRAPPRVRALSWILPEEQLRDGDPSQDVALATLLFLVDGKLVVLQPTTNGNGELKYEMRIVAHNVEYYALMRDQPYFRLPNMAELDLSGPEGSPSMNGFSQNDLRDSLWYFDGNDMNVWTDVQDVLTSSPAEFSRQLPSPIKVTTDFYPLSVLLNKGILFGVESDLIQRRDVSFSVLRFTTRTHLFLPPLLRHHLATYNSPAALHLSNHYQHLSYFPHALEVLLHNVLDDEVDHGSTPPPYSASSSPTSSNPALLPSVLSFLSSFPQFLDILVQCTRKTEVKAWRTLFAHLPPPTQLFEESLTRGLLKTAGGYLLVCHTLDAEGEGGAGVERSPLLERKSSAGRAIESAKEGGQAMRLLKRAREDGDWELCRELARFLMALDGEGKVLREALEVVGFGTGEGERVEGASSSSSSSASPSGRALGLGVVNSRERSLGKGNLEGTGLTDYFGER